MSYSHLVTRSGTAKKSSFQDRLAFMFMKVRCTGLPSPNPRKIRELPPLLLLSFLHSGILVPLH